MNLRIIGMDKRVANPNAIKTGLQQCTDHQKTVALVRASDIDGLTEGVGSGAGATATDVPFITPECTAQ